MSFTGKTFAANNPTLFKSSETNATGKPTSITVCKEIEKNILAHEKQYQFEYNEDGLVASKKILRWDQDSYKWNVTEEYKYEYNTQDQLVSQIYLKWDKAKDESNISAQQMLYIWCRWRIA